jgi:hypothetical protein
MYRWRVEPAKETEFVDSWTTITRYYLENCGGLGSRLHRGSDGVFYAYAQWPDCETHERAVLDVQMELARLHMKDAITEAFPKVQFEIVADHLVHPTALANDENR